MNNITTKAIKIILSVLIVCFLITIAIIVLFEEWGIIMLLSFGLSALVLVSKLYNDICVQEGEESVSEYLDKKTKENNNKQSA